MEEVSIGEFARRSRLSIKALRLYDEQGVLLPDRVDASSGYRYYSVDQLDDARFIAMFRQLDIPLATIKELLAGSRPEAAQFVMAHWQVVDAANDERRELAHYLIDQLNGKRSEMYEVAVREMPERAVLCLKRHVDEAGAWALGKECIGIFRDRPTPMIAGREGAPFLIFWGEVSADSDGPAEWCRPVPANEAQALAPQYPELELRIEPAHREAYVSIGVGNEFSPTQWQLASESLGAWAEQNGLDPENLELAPGDLGYRITYLFTESGPDSDFAVPFA